MVSFPLLVALFFIALTCFLSLRRRRNLPPGPFPFPIVGNMLQIGPNPHQSFAQLSKKYGPLMSIHLGSLYSVVVSSPEMAKEVLYKHGQVFSGRNVVHAVQDQNSMGFLPVDTVWRGMRKICKEQIFSHPSLEASEGLRQQQLRRLLRHVQGCCDAGRAVDIRDAAFITTLNLMFATLFSAQAAEFDSDDNVGYKELKETLEGVVNIAGVPNISDYVPFLKPFDLQGIKRRGDALFGKLTAEVESHLDRRLESRRSDPDAPRKNDFLETIVDVIQADEYGRQLTNDHFAHLMGDLLAGGSETNTTAIEWIMSELVTNPEKMAKLKAELKSVAGEEKLLEESDMARLPYLAAVIKEVLRIHPPGPLLFPRKALTDQMVNGYMIPKGTQLFFNVWAMGRDPSIWEDPDSFEPERFLDQKIDFKGFDFKLIPFGSGRRICPGMPLANRVMHMATATLVHNFDWELEQGMADVDHKGEMSGVTLRRAVPLRIIPINPS